MLSGLWILDQINGLYHAKRLENTLHILFRQIGMDWGHIDSVVVLGLLGERVYDRLCLWHIARSTDFDVATSHQQTIHLLQGQLCRFGRLELNEGKALVLVCCGVPGHAYGSDWSEGGERCAHWVFFDFVENTSDVNT